MTRTATFCLALLLASPPAFAAERCVFVREIESGMRNSVMKGRVLLDGSRYRVDLDPQEEPRGFDVLVSQDAGAQEKGIDLANHTWYTVKPDDPRMPTLPVLGLFPWNKKSADDVELAVVEKPEPEEVSGRPARRYDVHLSYKVKVSYPGDVVKGKVRLDAVLWMSGEEARPLPRMIRVDLQTGFAEIDSRLAAELAKLHGLPLRQELTASAEAEQTLPRTERVTVSLTGCEPAVADAARFEVPKGFTYKEPVMTGPGMGGAV